MKLPFWPAQPGPAHGPKAGTRFSPAQKLLFQEFELITKSAPHFVFPGEKRIPQKRGPVFPRSVTSFFPGEKTDSYAHTEIN